ncbi:hypothetical protein Tco_0292060 [Tanacetum coccineum]
MMAVNHRRHKQLPKALNLIKRLQTQMIEFERQLGPAKGPVQLELPEEAGAIGMVRSLLVLECEETEGTLQRELSKLKNINNRVTKIVKRGGKLKAKLYAKVHVGDKPRL